MGSVRRIREYFVDQDRAMTLPELCKGLEGLKPSQASMALCYLMRQRYVTREQIDNPSGKGRKVFRYKYSTVKLPKTDGCAQA